MVVPMVGWKRSMTFCETGLLDSYKSKYSGSGDRLFFYPSTGQLGELQLVNIGVGYSCLLRLWVLHGLHAAIFARQLNGQNLPGIYFHPFHYRPFFGRFSGKECHGVLLILTEPHHYLPVTSQYLIAGMLKSLYPEQFKKALEASSS